MKAIAIESYGGADRLALREIPDPPPPGPGEVRLAVRAASVNPVDWKVRSGQLRWLQPARFPLVPGLDVAGVVADIGPEVVDFAPGDAVFGYAGSGASAGAYAEQVVTRADLLAPKPASLTFEAAAALPCAGLTALLALRDHGRLGEGERVLVHGGAGGVGHLAIQIARILGAEVTATASARNLRFLRDLGAERAIDYAEEDFWLEDERYAVVLDAAAKSNFRDCAEVLSDEGGVYVTTVPSPADFGWFAITPLLALLGRKKRAKFVVAKASTANLALLAQWVDRGQLVPEIQEVFPLEAARRAHELSEAGHVRGKLVLRVESASG